MSLRLRTIDAVLCRLRDGMKPVLTAGLPALVAAAFVSSSATTPTLTLTALDSAYTIRSTFALACPTDTVLAALFEPGHIRKYLVQPNLSITVVDSEDNRNRIKYEYRYFVSDLMLTFDRRRRRDSMTVDFTLAASGKRGPIVPGVPATVGTYRLVPTADSVAVDYYQNTVFDKRINWLYLQVIRLETHLFLRNLAAYLESLCASCRVSE